MFYLFFGLRFNTNFLIRDRKEEFEIHCHVIVVLLSIQIQQQINLIQMINHEIYGKFFHVFLVEFSALQLRHLLIDIDGGWSFLKGTRSDPIFFSADVRLSRRG